MKILEQLLKELSKNEGIIELPSINNGSINYIQIMDDEIKFSVKINKQNFINTLISQTEKGINKYGHSLDECPDNKFNWNEMITEELADATQYFIKLQDALANEYYSTIYNQQEEDVIQYQLAL